LFPVHRIRLHIDLSDAAASRVEQFANDLNTFADLLAHDCLA